MEDQLPTDEEIELAAKELMKKGRKDLEDRVKAAIANEQPYFLVHATSGSLVRSLMDEQQGKEQPVTTAEIREELEKTGASCIEEGYYVEGVYFFMPVGHECPIKEDEGKFAGRVTVCELKYNKSSEKRGRSRKRRKRT